MNVLNQVDIIQPTSLKMLPDPNESALMECGRLIHAAVISQRFLNKLLTNPLKSIEDGYGGEKFAFTQEEKQQIRLIRASNLAEFSSQLIRAIEQCCCIAPAAELAYARMKTPGVI